jgi:hypothetical protein
VIAPGSEQQRGGVDAGDQDVTRGALPLGELSQQAVGLARLPGSGRAGQDHACEVRQTGGDDLAPFVDPEHDVPSRRRRQPGDLGQRIGLDQLDQ